MFLSRFRLEMNVEIRTVMRPLFLKPGVVVSFQKRYMKYLSIGVLLVVIPYVVVRVTISGYCVWVAPRPLNLANYGRVDIASPLTHAVARSGGDYHTFFLTDNRDLSSSREGLLSNQCIVFTVRRSRNLDSISEKMMVNLQDQKTDDYTVPVQRGISLSGETIPVLYSEKMGSDSGAEADSTLVMVACLPQLRSIVAYKGRRGLVSEFWTILHNLDAIPIRKDMNDDQRYGPAAGQFLAVVQ